MNTKKLLFLAATVVCGLPQSMQAGGIDLYEIGTPDTGLGSAGYASRVEDASVVFRNPGGMGFLGGPQFLAGVQLTYGSVQFSPNSNTSARLGAEDKGKAVRHPLAFRQ